MFLFKVNNIVEQKELVEAPGIDPGTSRMLSERSTIWATPPVMVLDQGFF